MAPTNADLIPADYATWLAELKALIRTARVKATPMGVSTFRTALPESVLSALPSIETLSEKLRTLPIDDVVSDGEDNDTEDT